MFLVALLCVYALFLYKLISQHAWLIDFNGIPTGGDFSCYWAAAHVAFGGHPLSVYHWDNLVAVLQPLVSEPIQYYYPFFYPPLFLLILLPLGFMGYATALIVWLLITVVLYLAASYCILPSKLGLRMALLSPGCLWAIAVGQNGLLTAALFGFGTVLLRSRPWIAGMCFGLLAIKPQLGMLIPLVLLVTGQWRVIAGAGIGVVVGVLLPGMVFGWSIFPVFFEAMQQAQHMLINEGRLDWFHIQSWYGTAKYLGMDNTIATIVQMLASIVTVVLLVRLWRSNVDYVFKAAALPLATLSAIHYNCIYDFPIITITVLWLLRGRGLKLADHLTIALCFMLILIQPVIGVPVGVPVYLLLATAIMRGVRAARSLSAAADKVVA